MLGFKELYNKEIVAELQKKFNYANTMELPKITKICVNMGAGEAALNSKVMEKVVEELTAICGQKPIVTKAKKSIASFKVREGMPIGAMATLRGEVMYRFLERLVLVAMPRMRDFKGLSKKSFDGKGNFSFGIKEQIVFPEIDYDKVDNVRGMDITIVTTAKNNEEAQYLLSLFHIPFIN
jgi:large subunit ribosomal protein L5